MTADRNVTPQETNSEEPSSATLTAYVTEAARHISELLVSYGYRADFTWESLGEIERFFAEQTQNGTYKKDGHLDDERYGGIGVPSFGVALFEIGSYLGETVRRTIGGVWCGSSNDPCEAELRFSTGRICKPIWAAMERMRSGRFGNLSSVPNVLNWGRSIRKT